MVAHGGVGAADWRQVAEGQRRIGVGKGVQVDADRLAAGSAQCLFDADLHFGDVEVVGDAERIEVKDAQVAVVCVQSAGVAGD